MAIRSGGPVGRAEKLESLGENRGEELPVVGGAVAVAMQRSGRNGQGTKTESRWVGDG